MNAQIRPVSPSAQHARWHAVPCGIELQVQPHRQPRPAVRRRLAALRSALAMLAAPLALALLSGVSLLFMMPTGTHAAAAASAVPAVHESALLVKKPRA